MKKILKFLLIFALFLPLVIIPMDTQAKTVRDLVNELNQLEQEYRDAKNKVKLTEQEINSAYNQIGSISNEIDRAHKDIVNTEQEIKELDELIVSKDAEIKEIMNFLQLSNGESAYLEYAFGAKDFTDFIYRVAISEQLANYNNNLIEEFNSLIIQNNTKIKELESKTIALNKKQESLEGQIVKLGDVLDEYQEVGLTVEDEIKAQKQLVSHYRDNLKCELDEPIATCGRRLPPGTAFYRPVTMGTVTSEYSASRIHPVTGLPRPHYGIDIGAHLSANVPIYAAAPGRVENIIHRTGCGGTMIFLNHIINGRNYTTVYMHLYRVNVSMGDIVTHNTQIGVMGGTNNRNYPSGHVRNLTPWDGCSTGLHLHFEIATGHFGNLGSSQRANTVNPRNLVNFPSAWSWFNGRNIRY